MTHKHKSRRHIDTLQQIRRVVREALLHEKIMGVSRRIKSLLGDFTTALTNLERTFEPLDDDDIDASVYVDPTLVKRVVRTVDDLLNIAMRIEQYIDEGASDDAYGALFMAYKRLNAVESDVESARGRDELDRATYATAVEFIDNALDAIERIRDWLSAEEAEL